MKLIWTYNSNVRFGVQVGTHTPERITILLNYYKQSIKTAIKLGYKTIIYCDSPSSEHFHNIADEVIVVDDKYENSQLWDSFKIKVLEERDDEFCLIDGDVILHNKLPNFTKQITFDSYEVNNFNMNYKDILNDLTGMGIGDKLSVWVNKKLPIISCGILSIKNDTLKQNYISNWKLYNKFILDVLDKVEIDAATMVGAQYLLTILSQDYTQQNLSNLVGGVNPYYRHYCGPVKYNNPIHNVKKILF